MSIFFFEFIDLALFAAAEFFLDGLELFVEVILFLGAFHLALDARVDVAVDIKLFELDFEDVADAVEALDGIDGLEQILFFVDGELQIGGDRVGKAGRVVTARRSDHSVVIQTLRELDELFVKAGDLLHGLVDLRGRLDAGVQQTDGGAEEAFFGSDGKGAGPLDALDQNFDIAIGELDALHDVRQRADGVDFLGLGVVNGSVVLCGQKNLFVAGKSLFESADAGFAANDEGRHLLRKDDHVAHRHHGYALQFLFFASEH